MQVQAARTHRPDACTRRSLVSPHLKTQLIDAAELIGLVLLLAICTAAVLSNLDKAVPL